MSEKFPTGTEKNPEHWELPAILRKGRKVMEEIIAESDEERGEDNR